MKIQVEGECSETIPEVEATLRELGYEPVAPGDEGACLRAWVAAGGAAEPTATGDDCPLLLIVDDDDSTRLRRLLLGGASDWLVWPRDRGLLGERLSVLRRRLGSGSIHAESLAHEINNPLTYVLANLEHVLATVEARDSDGLGPPIRDAIQGVEQIRSILQGVRSFGERRGDPLPSVELAPVVEGSLKILAERMQKVAQVRHEPGSIPQVLANEAQLRQVLLNLLTNALQSLPDRPREQNRITVSSRCHPEGVAIEVMDNGVGIDPRLLPRIFDAFFTTKKAQQGTGLGLSISTRLIMAMGGRIEADSVPGKGTTFRVILKAGQPAPSTSRQRLLLIEDEPLVVSLLQRLLSDRYDIAATDDAVEALGWLDAGQRFDAILSDMMLPGMSGMEFFRHLQARHPPLASRTGFITGGAFSDEARDFLVANRDRLLEKPFTTSSLKNFVTGLLRSS